MAAKDSGKGSDGGKSTDHRSAKTGRFVTEKYADAHKSTTVKETRKK